MQLFFCKFKHQSRCNFLYLKLCKFKHQFHYDFTHGLDHETIDATINNLLLNNFLPGIKVVILTLISFVGLSV